MVNGSATTPTGGIDMSKAIMFAAVSLDGFIAADDDTVGPLFDWYENGDVAGTFSDESRVFHTTRATADFLYELAPKMAAGVIGRRLFDLTNGWNGVPANGEHVFVVTHRPPTDWAYRDTAPFTFVDGVRSAIEQAKEFAGPERDVSVSAGDIGGQALREGLIDQVVMNLVPAVLGTGRPFFGTGGMAAPVLFDDPRVVQGKQVTHLVYDVRR
jgi:dihydrofolate reductase